jgi:hypothetical protein
MRESKHPSKGHLQEGVVPRVLQVYCSAFYFLSDAGWHGCLKSQEPLETTQGGGLETTWWVVALCPNGSASVPKDDRLMQRTWLTDADPHAG